MLELWHIIFISQIPLLWIISGLCRSLVHTLLHHYPEFKKKFQIENDEFWNPEISWEGKYEHNEDGTLKLDENNKLIKKKGIIIPWYDAFHRFNTIEVICDFIREGIYIGLLIALIFNLSIWMFLIAAVAGIIMAGAIKILISFNLGYDKIWR